MKQFNKVSVVFYLAIILFFNFLLEVKAQEQVVIKGNSTTTSYEGIIDETLRSLAIQIHDHINSNGHGEFTFGSGAPIITSQNFTITYTQEMMHMVGTIEPSPHQQFISDAERNEYYQRNTMTMILRFNPEGTQLDMAIKTPNQTPLTMRVPKSNTIESSNTQNLLTAVPVSNSEINGFDTGKYNFSTESDLVLQKAIINGQPIKLKRVDEGEVWLASDVPGTGLMRGFYLNLNLGGYDLSGAEKGGITALMGRLLERGMLIKAKETMTVSSFDRINDNYILKTFTETNINSVIVEPFNNELLIIPNDSQNPEFSPNSQSPLNSEQSSESTSDSQTDSSASNSQNGSSNTSNGSVSNECDCSCEKYAEYMKKGGKNKRGKKNKKQIDMENLQQLDVSCLKKCITKWATKCISIKN